MGRRLKLGCIADDFTGAGDAASFLVEGGLRTKLIIWPKVEKVSLTDCDAVVVALKSRSLQAQKAVEETLAVLRWMKQLKVEKYYFKYCSTFDSTPAGNIGPVCDRLLEELGQKYTILCPSLLSNGRSVEDGILYVNGIPLGESSMRVHPLNPMWSSSLRELMECQSKYPVFPLREAEYANPASIDSMISKLEKENLHFYIVPDFYKASHGDFIAEYFEQLSLWTGGSELLNHFARTRVSSFQGIESYNSAPLEENGKLILAGSCSSMTQKQVKYWIDQGRSAIMVRLDRFDSKTGYLDELVESYLSNPGRDILFYSSGSAGLRVPQHNDGGAARKMELILSQLAEKILANAKVKRLIIAGGETSGAVTLALGLRMFDVGSSLAPGVPVLYPCENIGMRIVLKSGNFGEEDFFVKALEE